MLDPASAAEPLEGAGLAIAHGTIFLKPDVAELAGVVVGSRVEFPVNDQACAEPRAEGHEYHIPCPFPGPETPLRQGAGVRVVMDRRRGAELLGEDPDYGNIVPSGQVRGRHYHSRRAVQRAAATDPDGSDAINSETVPGQDIPDASLDRCDRPVHVCGGETRFVLNENIISLRKPEGDGAFCAADVNSYQHFLCHIDRFFIPVRTSRSFSEGSGIPSG